MPDRLRSLPLFPLELVLYPGARQPLHIFEERYKDLAADCLDTGAPFGIVLTEDEVLRDIGATAEIEEVARRYDDAPDHRLSFVIAQNAALDTSQKQDVLELRSEPERMTFLSEHLQALLPRVEEQQTTRERIRSNGHFEDFPIDD